MPIASRGEIKMKTIRKIICAWLLAAGLSAAGGSSRALAKETMPAGPFFVYADSGSNLNHYVPAGWMGDHGDLMLAQAWERDVQKPSDKRDAEVLKIKKGTAHDTCLQIRYSGRRRQGAGWAGMVWQHPAGNWGDKDGGFDLSRYKVIRFWARGEAGGESIDKFFVGGITGQMFDGDTDEVILTPVTLAKEWKLYEIDLSAADMRHMIGGFGFGVNADANAGPITFYLDEIRFEKK